MQCEVLEQQVGRVDVVGLGPFPSLWEGTVHEHEARDAIRAGEELRQEDAQIADPAAEVDHRDLKGRGLVIRVRDQDDTQ